MSALAKSKRERACAMRLDLGRGREKVGGRRSKIIAVSGGGAMEALLYSAIEKKKKRDRKFKKVIIRERIQEREALHGD